MDTRRRKPTPRKDAGKPRDAKPFGHGFDAPAAEPDAAAFAADKSAGTGGDNQAFVADKSTATERSMGSSNRAGSDRRAAGSFDARGDAPVGNARDRRGATQRRSTRDVSRREPLSANPRTQLPTGVPLPVGIAFLAVVLVLCLVVIPMAFDSADKEPVANAQNIDVQMGSPEGADIAEGTYDDEQPSVLYDRGRTTASGMGRLSFSAWGDVIATDHLLEIGHDAESDTYDFTPQFANVAPWVKGSCDVSFINMETAMGGTDNGFGIAGYPSFNTPDTMADAIEGAGYRVVSFDSNHSYDTWVKSLEHSQDVWAAKEGIALVGSYRDEQDRAAPRVVECNGIRVSFLAYSYGQNGYDLTDLPNDFYAVPWDEDAMKEDVARAKKVSDAVVVYLHMGTEYTNEPNEQQRAAAQASADAGADLIIGSHAHVIQPVEKLKASDGREVWCAYGLGDAVSGYPNNPDCIYSGVFTCDFIRGEDGAVTVQNPGWRPTVEHRETAEDGTVTDTVYFVSDYSKELAEKNQLLVKLSDPWEWVTGESKRVVGDAVRIY